MIYRRRRVRSSSRCDTSRDFCIGIGGDGRSHFLELERLRHSTTRSFEWRLLRKLTFVFRLKNNGSFPTSPHADQGDNG